MLVTLGLSAPVHGEFLLHASAVMRAIAAFERLAHTLVAWWDADDDRYREGREQNPCLLLGYEPNPGETQAWTPFNPAFASYC